MAGQLLDWGNLREKSFFWGFMRVFTCFRVELRDLEERHGANESRG